MKSPPWKTLGELVGIAALVTSLVFVGYQLKQDRQVATMQVRADWIERNAGLYAEINQHAEVLARANSGAELSESEAITVRNLVGTAFDIVLSIRYPFMELQGADIGADPRPSELQLAAFLYKNPGARRAWLEISK
jgi:hypothetical protein